MLVFPSPSFAGSKAYSLLSQRWPLTLRKSRYTLSLYYPIIFKTLLITAAVLLLEMGFTPASEAWVEPSPRCRSWFWFDLNGLHSNASAAFTCTPELCKSSKLLISGSLLNNCVPAPATESYDLYFLPSLSSWLIDKIVKMEFYQASWLKTLFQVRIHPALIFSNEQFWNCLRRKMQLPKDNGRWAKVSWV